MNIREKAIELISKITDLPIASKKGTRRGPLAPPSYDKFINLEPINFDIPSSSEGTFVDTDPSVIWPVDVGMIVNKEDGSFVVQRLRTIRLSEARGLAKLFFPQMAQLDFGTVINNELTTMSGIVAHRGGEWIDAVNGPGVLQHSDQINLNLCLGIALNQRYTWGVSVGRRGLPSIRFVTDPTGIKEVFRLRDAPAGKDRREALINWVSDHWRKNRIDPDVENYVRKSLRGKGTFSWEDFDCTILPSKFDQDKLQEIIKRREEMKQTGTDRRRVST